MNTEHQDRSRWTKWLLFAALLITVPVPFYMVVVGGLMPTFLILFLAVQGLIVALPKFSVEGFVMVGILWSHVGIFGCLLYLVACGIDRVLFRVLPARYAFLVVFGLIAGLLVASTFEIYRLPGHNSAPPANLLRILKEFIP